MLAVEGYFCVVFFMFINLFVAVYVMLSVLLNYPSVYAMVMIWNDALLSTFTFCISMLNKF